ncbi:MAG: succinyl-diaminopimelate desuccinylase [Actinomycetota bacterium]|nr:succinyl-diaminopimelate desuccinylase [Actinomycetota bacterium]
MSLTPLLLELLEMPCLTGEEGPVADWLAERYRDEPLRRVGNSVVVGQPRPGHPTVLLVSHTDVVPPTDADRSPRREAGRVVGRGASDMKSGMAVALDCFDDPALRYGPYAPVLVCYAGEEGSHEGNELGGVLDAVDFLHAAELAVVLEPTDLTVQLGCLGGLHAELAFSGRAAHSARPWQGDNALTAAGAVLAELHEREPEDVRVDGLVYREVLTATQAWTANARNVVPDRFVVNVNYRFAPDKALADAERRLRDLVGGHADVDVVDRAPPGRPRRDAPLVDVFTRHAGGRVAPKQAWTDVARLDQAGIPALNYGPGLTAQAHQSGEYVPEGNLTTAREVVGRFLEG